MLSCMLQKELVRWMADGKMSWAVYHRWLGMFSMLCMIAMFSAGFLMGPYSTWEGFDVFSFFFAAPFAIWTATIYISARWGQFRWHRLFANQCFKGLIFARAFCFFCLLDIQIGCLAVPLARLAGALVQKYAPHLGEAQGYYVGIGCVTGVIALWEMFDIYFFVLRPCAIEFTSRGKQKKKML